MPYVKGDIVWVPYENRDKKKLKHPAVIWEYSDDDTSFIGIMLTHAEPNGRFENILMKEDHFLSEHEVTFLNTHFVNQLFNKFQDWGPFYKAGRLTGEGISFIEEHLKQASPLNFDDYIKR